MNQLARIAKYVKPYMGYVGLNVLFNLISVLFSLVSLTMIAPFLGLLFNKIALVTVAPEVSFNPKSIIQLFYYLTSDVIIHYGKVEALWFISLLIVVLFLLKNLFRYLGMYFMAPVRNGVVKDIRNDLYQHFLILPIAFFKQNKKGDLLSRMSADVQEIEWSIMNSLIIIIREPLTIIAFLITLIAISPKITLLALILIPIIGFIVVRVSKELKKVAEVSQKKLGQILSVLEETLSGLRVIKAFNAIDIMKKRFQQINSSYTRLMTGAYRIRDLAPPMTEFLGASVLVTIMWFGGRLVLSPGEHLNADVFIAYIAIFSQLVPPSQAFVAAFYNVQKGLASANRVYEVLDAEEVILEKTNPIAIKSFDHQIEYKHVSFAYDTQEVLDDINLLIPKGRSIAVVGPSGSGKSTMVDLLPRFYECSSGELLIDGKSVKDYVISDIRMLMGIVSQETILFNDTVLNNIAFGINNISEEEVIEAAKIAHAHEFIEQMPKGYHTNIGDRGVKLSGGQRQRISIARAVLKNPPILILDEATSLLDTESERLVQDAITRIMKNRTSIVIAHRLSTVKFVDEIIVLDQGKIAERGTHNELLAKNGVYKRLYELQSFE